MGIKLIGCAVLGAWVMTGCSSMAPPTATSAVPAQPLQVASQGIDYQRIAAVESQARYQGVQVIWVREPMSR